MKRLIKIIGFVLVLSFSIAAQEKDAANTGAAEQKQNKSGQENKAPALKKGFVDANGDGINDNAPRQKRQRGKQKTDKFVDADGDGINDNRCQGLGFGNKGQMKMYGKRGK